MSELKKQLELDLKNAILKSDDAKSTLRMVLSVIRKKELDTGKDLSDEGIIMLLQKENKIRKDSAKQYKVAGRSDLYDQELKEVSVISKYLPEMLSRDEIIREVKKVISDVGATTKVDMGKVMKGLASLRGKADMGLVSLLVREYLK